MPKHVDCPQPQPQALTFATATSCPLHTPKVTLHIDVASAHRLGKEDAGVLPRAVIYVHPAGTEG